MSEPFYEGVKPGGLTNSKEIRILICYILDSVASPVNRSQLEEVLLGEELVNYFVMAESLSQLLEQGLITGNDEGYTVTETGHTVAQTLAHDVPKTVRDTAIRGVIRAQQFANNAAAHHCQITKIATGHMVEASIGDEEGSLFELKLYMPDEMAANSVKDTFILQGDTVYKMVLGALTNNKMLAEKALQELEAKCKENE